MLQLNYAIHLRVSCELDAEQGDPRHPVRAGMNTLCTCIAGLMCIRLNCQDTNADRGEVLA